MPFSTEVDRPLYQHRRHAGEVLAGQLAHYRTRQPLLVLALPRGGVEVAAEVARVLDAELDVFMVRKLGFPGRDEYAMGAIASGGVRVLNEGLRLDAAVVDRVAAREQKELERREQLYRGDAGPAAIAGRTVLVVDDGLATGATMRAALQAIRQRRPAHLCAAAPIGSQQACDALGAVADAVVCPARPEPFVAVGVWYADFPQASDAQVRWLLEHAHVLH